MKNETFELNKFRLIKTGNSATAVNKVTGEVFGRGMTAHPDKPCHLISDKGRTLKLKNSVVRSNVESFLDGATFLAGSAASQAGVLSRRLKSLGFEKADTHSTATFYAVSREGFEVSRLGCSNRVVLSYRMKNTGDRKTRIAAEAAKVAEMTAALESRFGIRPDSRGHFVAADA
jgi:hypothetical protein